MNGLTSFVRRASNMFFSATQFIVPFFSEMTGKGRSVDSQVVADITKSPEIPAGYAFSIWFVIFALAIVYSFYQLIPYGRQEKVCSKIGFYTAALFALSTIWMLTVQVSPYSWPLIIIVLAMLACSLKAFFVFINEADNDMPFERWVIAPMLGLESGWLTVALFLNLSSLLKQSSIGTLGLSTNSFASLIIIAASCMAIWILAKSGGNMWYGSAVLWALYGIIIADVVVADNIPVAGVACVLSIIFIVAVVYSRRLSNHSSYEKQQGIRNA